MAKFVMANRRAGKFQETEKTASRDTLESAFSAFERNVRVISDLQPENRQLRRVVVFEAETAEMEARAREMPEDVLLEPEILHWKTRAVPLDLLDMQRTSPALQRHVGSGRRIEITVTGSGDPLEGAEVLLFLRGLGDLRRKLEGRTNAKGTVAFSFSTIYRSLGVIVVPAGGFWDVLVRGGGDTIAVDCPPLPAIGPLAWWHRVLGITEFDERLGDGIRVGVVDSGVGPHPCLDHVTNIGSFIDSDVDPNGGADSGSHGSHVNGIIGARPRGPGQAAGVAPGAILLSARVFPPGLGANQGDIANAIDALSMTHEADLINMSLGAPQPSRIEQDAIQDALERGTLCICAAANSGGFVEWPAAFPETVAVSALGLLGWVPAQALDDTIPRAPDKFGDGDLYLADFSCFGPEISCAAPGVGIISTVPERYGLTAPFRAMNGTSMASPAACGALAALLSGNNQYKNLPRDESRAAMARTILRTSCRDIGLKAEYQGRGVLDVA